MGDGCCGPESKIPPKKAAQRQADGLTTRILYVLSGIGGAESSNKYPAQKILLQTT